MTKLLDLSIYIIVFAVKYNLINYTMEKFDLQAFTERAILSYFLISIQDKEFTAEDLYTIYSSLSREHKEKACQHLGCDINSTHDLSKFRCIEYGIIDSRILHFGDYDIRVDENYYFRSLKDTHESAALSILRRLCESGYKIIAINGTDPLNGILEPKM